MPNILADSISVTLTAATAGALTCASTIGLFAGQRGWAVDSAGENNLEVIVVSVISGTQFLCQTLANINNGGGADLSAYDGGTFYFEKQLVEIPGAGADTGSLDALAVGKVPAKQSDGTFAAATTENIPVSTNKNYVTDTQSSAVAALAAGTVGALVKIGSDGKPADASVTDAQLSTIYAATRPQQVACPVFVDGAASIALGTGKHSECVVEATRTLAQASALDLPITNMVAGHMFAVTCKALTLGYVLSITSAGVTLKTFESSLTRAKTHYFFFDGLALYYDQSNFDGA